MDFETPGLLIREVDGLSIFRLRANSLSGTSEIAHIVAEVENSLIRGTRQFIVDLKYVEFVGSAALGMLINVQKRIKSMGGKMVLSHPEHIAELLRVSRTGQLFKIAVDLSEARKLFT